MVQSIMDKIAEGSLDLTSNNSGVIGHAVAPPITNLNTNPNPASNSSCC